MNLGDRVLIKGSQRVWRIWAMNRNDGTAICRNEEHGVELSKWLPLEQMKAAPPEEVAVAA